MCDFTLGSTWTVTYALKPVHQVCVFVYNLIVIMTFVSFVLNKLNLILIEVYTDISWYLLQALNPVLIIIFIPLFEVVIYPCIRHFNIPFRPLQRMAIGMMLAALAFVMAGVIQMRIDVSVMFKYKHAPYWFINSVLQTHTTDMAIGMLY